MLRLLSGNDALSISTTIHPLPCEIYSPLATSDSKRISPTVLNKLTQDVLAPSCPPFPLYDKVTVARFRDDGVIRRFIVSTFVAINSIVA